MRSSQRDSGKNRCIAVYVIVAILTSVFTTYQHAGYAQSESESVAETVEVRPMYDDTFGIQTPITATSNNGGAYSTSVLARAFDGDIATHWETGRRNTENFKNHVIVSFAQSTQIGRVVYYPRTQGAPNKGYPKQLSIYASTSNSGDDFTLVHHGSYPVVDGPLTIDLGQNHEFKRLKFTFDQVHEDWASIAELKFYTHDALTHAVNALFADNLYSSLVDGVTAEHVEALYQQSLTHPDEKLTQKLQFARDILAGADVAAETFTIKQEGDVRAHTTRVLKMTNFGSSHFPTGLAASPDDRLTVYVDGEAGKPLPRIVFSQNQGIYHHWKRAYQLKLGENILTVPTMPNPGNVVPGGPIYIENPYTPEEQGRAPRIRIVGAYQFPLFRDGDSPEEFKAEVETYIARRAEAPERYADIVEIANDWITATGTTGNAHQYIDGTGNPQVALDFAKKRYMELLGFAAVTDTGDTPESDPKTWILKPHQMVRVMTMPKKNYFAYAAGDHTGFFESTMTNYFTGNTYGWGIAHELGHHLDPDQAKWPEVTNNMWANYNEVLLEGKKDRISPAHYDRIFANNSADDYRASSQAVNDLAIFWQLHLLDKTYWPRYQMARRDNLFPQLNEVERIVALSSYVLGFDATEHFDRHRYFDRRYSNDDARREVSITKIRAALNEANVPERPADMKPWYLWSKNLTSDSTFVNLAAPSIDDITYSSGQVMVTVRSEQEREAATVGYELMVDGKVVAFSRTRNITVSLPDDGADRVFTVRAFDTRLTPTNSSQPVTFNSQEPKILMTGSTLLPVGATREELLKVVSAYDAADAALTATVDTSGIDLNRVGRYLVPFSTSDSQGRTHTRAVAIDVVPRATYISDMEPTHARVGYATMTRDRNLDGRDPLSLALSNGQEFAFSKGIGAHAAASITYDLSDRQPKDFEAYIGIDGVVRQSSGNLIMRIKADGQVIYDSGTLTSSTPAQHVKLDITGVKTLELISDSNGAITADHSVWAMARISEYMMADVWEPHAAPLTKNAGDTVTSENILAQVTVEAPAESVISKELMSPIPTTGSTEVTVRVTYADGSYDSVAVPVTFTPANYTSLRRSIEQATAAVSVSTISVDGHDIERTQKWTTRSEVDSLNALIQRAEKILAAQESSQGYVDREAQSLTQAVLSFMDAQQLGTKPEAEPEPELREVIPIQPRADDPATCSVPPHVLIPQAEGVVYVVHGTEAPQGRYEYDYGQTVTVLARAREGFVFPSDAVTTWTWTAPSRADLRCDISSQPQPTDPAAPTEDPSDSGKSDNAQSGGSGNPSTDKPQQPDSQQPQSGVEVPQSGSADIPKSGGHTSPWGDEASPSGPTPDDNDTAHAHNNPGGSSPLTSENKPSHWKNNASHSPNLWKAAPPLAHTGFDGTLTLLGGLGVSCVGLLLVSVRHRTKR